VCFALGIVALCIARGAAAQLAPTGGHYAARPSDTGFMGVVNGSGGYSTSVPLDLPPARGGLPIPLSVVYGARGVGAAGLGWDVPLSYVSVNTFLAHRRPTLDLPANPKEQYYPRARKQVTVSLGGQVIELAPRGDAWVGRYGGLALTLTQQGSGYVMNDGSGLTYRFTTSSTLIGTGLALLTSITGAGGASVTLTYAIATPSVPGGTALSIDLSTITYNSHPSTTCPKHLLQLLYSAPPPPTTPPTPPLAMSMIGTRALARVRTLVNIYVRTTPSCGTDSVLLRNYAFTYTPDADTGLPRLASVTVSGRGDSKDRTVLPVASYSYGSATSRDFTTAPPQRVMAYQLAQTIPIPDAVANDNHNLGSTTWVDWDIGLPPDVTGHPLITWQALADVTGDGRADLVFSQQEDSLWVAPNVALGGSLFTFASAVPLQDANYAPGAFEIAAASNSVRYRRDLNRPYETQRQWRMAIDLNGDGRLDILDAAEQPNVWVAHLNTPGPDPGQPVWVSRTIDLTDVRARLQALLPADDAELANHIPLANRKTAPASKTWLSCQTWDSGASRWNPSPDKWSPRADQVGTCHNDSIGNHDNWGLATGDELTITEWEIKDLNGDGYPDLVFNSSQAAIVAVPPADWVPSIQPKTDVVAFVYNFDIFGPSEVDALLNVAGVRLDEQQSTRIFSVAASTPAAVRLSDDNCGVERWITFNDQQQDLNCGLADVNGDGIIDRVVGNTVHLGMGTYTAGVADASMFTITLPDVSATPGSGVLAIQMNPRTIYPDNCDNDPSSTFHPFQQVALRDITGDGIPDYIVSDVTGKSWTVAIGTGVGFSAPIPIVGPFSLSFEEESCKGDSAHTLNGLFDFDGDGKPEQVWIGAGGINVAQLVGDTDTPATPEAGKLVAVGNGYGAVTQIDYRSAKEDPSAPHQVPFPEIVVERVQTTGNLGLGGSLTPTFYAYGQPIWMFDPMHDGFRMAAYARTIELQLAPPGPTAGTQAIATITDALPLPDWSSSLTPQERFGRYLRAGQVSDVTVLAGDIGSDPWALLSVNVTTDPRSIAGTHYDTGARLFNEVATGSKDCLDIMAPYDWQDPADGSGQEELAFDSCTAHGFEYTRSVSTWRGSAAPPSEANVQTLTYLRTISGADAIDDFGRPTTIVYQNDLRLQDDNLCVDFNYAEPQGTGAPVRSAPSTRTTWDCTVDTTNGAIPPTYAFESFEYDGMAVGSVGAGLLTAHSVLRHAADTGEPFDLVREFDIAYDAAANPSILTRQREDGATQTATLTYDPFGLVVTHAHTDASGAPSTDVFTTVDPVSLDILSVQDENGTQHGAFYDGFGRPTKLTVTPSGAVPGALASFGYFNFAAGSTGGRYVTQTTFTDPVPLANAGSATGRSSTTYVDELGRELYTQISLGADYTDSVIAGSRLYDGFGRVFFEADPYPLSQGASYGTTRYYALDGAPSLFVRGNGPQPYTTVPDAASERFPTYFRHSFSGFVESFSVQDADALTKGSPQQGVIRDTLTSAVGRLLARSTWQNGTRIEHAQFSTDHLGHLTGMTRWLDAVSPGNPAATSWRYDSLGQLLSLQEPELPLQTRSYSRFGELLSTQWAPPAPEPSHALVNRYDALGRLVHTEEQNGGATDPDTVKDFFYDAASPISPQVTPTNLVGRLAHAISPTGDVYLSYDGFGNVNARTFTDESAALYVEKASYHGDGSLATLEVDLPDNGYRPEQVSYGYDSAGRLRSTSYSDGTITEPIYLAQTRDPLGRIRAATFGKATYAASYADVGRRLLQSVSVSSPFGSRQVAFNGYDPLGRELSRTEGTGSAFTQSTFVSAYDGLGRLASSLKRNALGTVANRSFTYDALGNATGLTDNFGNLGAFVTVTGPNADPDRMCSVQYGSGPAPVAAGCNVTHDSAGNVTNQPTRTGTRTLTYYNSGAARTISDSSGATAAFRYGALGDLQELDVTGASSDTRHDRNYGGLIARHDQTSGGVTTQVLSRQFGGGGVGAIRRGPNGPWVFQFAEGRGTRFTFDENGAILQDVEYEPFGEAASLGAEPGSAQYSSEQWNGGDALAALGVVNVGARIYDPVVGRFLSRDPLLIPRTAATTNPYAFAFNDPVNHSDPTGGDPCAEDPSCYTVGPPFAGGGLGRLGQVVQTRKPADHPSNTAAKSQAYFEAMQAVAMVESAALSHVEVVHLWIEDVPSISDMLLAPYHAWKNWNAAAKDLVGPVAGNMLYMARAAAGKDPGPLPPPVPPGAAKRFLWASVDLGLNAVAIATVAEGLLPEVAGGAAEAEELVASGAGREGCFTAGTLVATNSGSTPIETVQAGDRVQSLDESACGEPIDPQSCRSVDVELDAPDPLDRVSARLLRPLGWIHDRRAEPGAAIRLDFDELGVHGWARVQNIGACSLAAGPGCTVTGTVTRLNRAVLRLHFVESPETLEATATHPLRSLDRASWVRAGELTPGELLRTQSGAVTVSAIEPLDGVHRVFNLEVGAAHTYLVSGMNIYAHNISAIGWGGIKEPPPVTFDPPPAGVNPTLADWKEFIADNPELISKNLSPLSDLVVERMPLNGNTDPSALRCYLETGQSGRPRLLDWDDGDYIRHTITNLALKDAHTMVNNGVISEETLRGFLR
jgi:RHS repeat-associated protein